MKKVIGYIKYYDSNEIVQFTDKKTFLEEIKNTLYYYGINGWGYLVYNDINLQKEINNLISDEFGF